MSNPAVAETPVNISDLLDPAQNYQIIMEPLLPWSSTGATAETSSSPLTKPWYLNIAPTLDFSTYLTVTQDAAAATIWQLQADNSDVTSTTKICSVTADATLSQAIQLQEGSTGREQLFQLTQASSEANTGFWLLPLERTIQTTPPYYHRGLFYIISAVSLMHLTLIKDWSQDGYKEVRQYDLFTKCSAWRFEPVPTK